MMDFDCPLAFRHKKRGVHLGFETLVEVFVFKEEIYFFFWLKLVEIKLYLGASLCIYLFGS